MKNMSSSVDPDDQPFQHYTAKHRVVAWVSRNLFDWTTYTVRHGLVQGMKRKGGLGWFPLAGSGETEESRFWRSLALKGLVVYDIGAFHGILTLFFSRSAKAVISYEPNTHNNKRLHENLKLNGVRNVTVRKIGIGSEAKHARMVFSRLMPGGASVEPNVATQIAQQGLDTRTEDIQITTLDQDIGEQSLPAPEFIKIDIEGFELEALRGARETLTRHRPALFLEMHGDTLNEKKHKVAAIVSYLEQLNYGDIFHVQTGTRITGSNSAVAAQGHLYCPAGRSGLSNLLF